MLFFSRGALRGGGHQMAPLKNIAFFRSKGGTLFVKKNKGGGPLSIFNFWFCILRGGIDGPPLKMMPPLKKKHHAFKLPIILKLLRWWEYKELKKKSTPIFSKNLHKEEFVRLKKYGEKILHKVSNFKRIIINYPLPLNYESKVEPRSSADMCRRGTCDPAFESPGLGPSNDIQLYGVHTCI